jgi:hypothetical protein
MDLKTAAATLLSLAATIAACASAQHRKVAGPPPEYELPEEPDAWAPAAPAPSRPSDAGPSDAGRK